MNIRRATLEDFETLYHLGLQTKEFRVSSTEPFMAKDEFLRCITSPLHLFPVAEDQRDIAGFILVDTSDKDRGFKNTWACLVYIVVRPRHQRQGIASQLFDVCEGKLKKLGMSHLYCWAHTHGNMIDFMKAKGLSEGFTFVWMDKRLATEKNPGAEEA